MGIGPVHSPLQTVTNPAPLYNRFSQDLLCDERLRPHYRLELLVFNLVTHIMEVAAKIIAPCKTGTIALFRARPVDQKWQLSSVGLQFDNQVVQVISASQI
jgi:hypothetical protein